MTHILEITAVQHAHVQILILQNHYLQSNLMAILENIENSWNEIDLQYESLAMKIFSDFCCNGCSCKSESDHNK